METRCEVEEGEEFLGSKLRRGISLGKKGGSRTPVPSWKLEDPAAAGPSSPSAPPRRSSAAAAAAAAVSARKLGANLWEVQDLGRSGAHRRHKDELPADRHDQPQSAGSLRRHTPSSLIQQHKLNRRNIQVQQPSSPATYSSSTEISTVHRAINPSSSLDFKGMLREGREGLYNLKTSTELVKVLNRIWSLEEQHASTVSQVKELRAELKHAEARIQELMYEKQTYSHQMDNLVNQIAEDKLIRKKKVQDKIKTAVQSVRDELEDERKLRRKSESLHRKLVKELSEAKVALSKALNDLDREKEANSLVENLCDVLAEGVRNYELEVRELQQKTVKEHDHKADRWILHISEAWLDERMQMEIAEAQGDTAEKNTIMDRLRTQVMAFLQARQSKSSTKDVAFHNNVNFRRQSLESVHLNGAGSAPQDAEDDDDSIASDLHCFELNLGANDHGSNDRLEAVSETGAVKLDNAKMLKIRRKKLGYCARHVAQNSSSLQVEPRKLVNTMAFDGNKTHMMDSLHGSYSHNNTEAESMEPNQVEIALSHISKNFSPQEVGLSIEIDDTHKSNLLIDNSVKLCSELSEDKDHHGEHHGEDCYNQCSKRGQYSSNGLNSVSGEFVPFSNPEISESSSRLARATKDNTLKAKLLEARLEGRHARMKASKSSSIA